MYMGPQGGGGASGGGMYNSAGNLYGSANRPGFPLGLTSAPMSPMGSQGSGLNQSLESFWPSQMHAGHCAFSVTLPRSCGSLLRGHLDGLPRCCATLALPQP